MDPKLQKLVIKELARQQVEKERKLWMERCINAITASFAANLLGKWDWTPEDVNKLIASANTNFEDMWDEFVTIDDFIQWSRENGITI
jgi:protoheme ferro-lyase